MEERITEPISKRFQTIESKILEAFGKIREEMNDHNQSIDRMRSYLKEWEGKTSEAWKNDESLRKRLEHQIDGFNENIGELKLALSSVKSIKNEVVITKDLSKIEERIRSALREELKDVKEVIKENQKRITALEKTLEKGTSVVERQKKTKDNSYPKGSSKKLSKQEEKKKARWSLSSNFDDGE